MIRFGPAKNMWWPGIDTDDRLELKKDKIKPSWLPRGRVKMVVRYLEEYHRAYGWRPRHYLAIVDPGHQYNLHLGGEVLVLSNPHNAKMHWKPYTLDTLDMTVDHIDESMMGYGQWLDHDRGYAVATQAHLLEWTNLPDFQKRLIDLEMRRRSTLYERSRTPDRIKAGAMLQNGVLDADGRRNPRAKVLQLGALDRALGRQAVHDNVTANANRRRRGLVSQITDYQLEMVQRVIASGDPKPHCLLKLPYYGVNYIHNQGIDDQAVRELVMECELYFSVIYRELSAIGKGAADPSQLSVPPARLDFSRLPGYDALAELVLGRVEDLMHRVDGLESKALKQHTTNTQSLLRNRVIVAEPSSHVWLNPELSQYLTPVTVSP